MTRLEAKLAWAAWIDGLIDRTGVTCIELGELCGVSAQLVSHWRKAQHKNMPTDEQQAKLIEYARKHGLVP